MMHEDMDTQIAALNAIWQRYARTANEHLDPDTAEALNRDYLAVWDALAACGVEEWMLQYDADTLTFALATAPEQVNEKDPTGRLTSSHVTGTGDGINSPTRSS